VEEDLDVLDEFQEEALLDEVMDAAAVRGGPFAELVRGPGFRAGVRGAVAALELAGVRVERLAANPVMETSKRDFLARVLRRYRTRVREEGRVGLAGILGRASHALGDGAPLRWDRILLLPGLSLRGASGQLVRALLARGAHPLGSEPLLGRTSPPSLLWHSEGEAGPFSAVLGGAFREESPPGEHEAGAPTRPEAAASEGGGPSPLSFGSDAFDESLQDLPLFAAADPLQQRPPPPPPPPPELTLFAAGGAEAELLEVLRRVLASGFGWGDVEIVTPDPAAYGAVLQGLTERLGIPATFAVGLPVERTLPGRAIAAYLDWLREGFPADGLRILLARGDLRAPRPWNEISPGRLARTLRGLRIGWGRGRYMPALDRAVLRARARVEEAQDQEARVRLDRELQATLGLRALVHGLLDSLPERSPGTGSAETPIAPSRLAIGLRRLLDLLQVEGEVDETARDRLRRILDRVEAHLQRPAPLGVALATLEDHLAIRVPAPRAEGRAPWVSDAGSLHLSDLEHGGLSGRPLTFIVGLDSGRFPGAPLQDPLLLDRERRTLSADLPTVSDRIEESGFAFAALLARLRGRVSLSYSVWDAASARNLMPSPVLLRAFRWSRGDPGAGFEALRESLGQPVSRIPRQGGAVDAEDIWLGSLASDQGFYAGAGSVRRAFPWLDRGRTARDAWNPGEPPSHFTGLVDGRSEAVQRTLDSPFSPTRLEALGSCPLRFFLGSVLRLRAPEDPEYLPDRWLDPRDRGSLLHRVYELLVQAARDEALAPDSPEMASRADEILTRAVSEFTGRVPPPSMAVRDREAEDLRTDVECFLVHLASTAAQEPDRQWTALEAGFGSDDEEVLLDVGELAIKLRGRPDRVDRVGSGELVVVDYKTGRAGSLWTTATGTWREGRRLQHLIYSRGAAHVLGASVQRVEYHFPTRKGEGRVIGFRSEELQEGVDLLATLLDGARSGAFVPTDDAGDCRYCDFGPICRVRPGRYDDPRSPAADFGKAAMEAEFPEMAWLARVRAWEKK
jgi:ATP-dependent helicase/nuclease subunit B